MDVIAKLREEQQALRARISEIEVLIEEYANWERRVSNVVLHTKVTNEANDDDQRSITPDLPVTPMNKFEEAVLEALSKADHPRHRTELLADLKAMGIVVGGSDERNTLSARLTRMGDGITNIRGYGYWITGRPYEPAGYPRTNEFVVEGDETSERRLPPEQQGIFD